MPASVSAHFSLFWDVAIIALATFGVVWLSFWRAHNSSRSSHFFFDPQDLFPVNPEYPALLESAKTATFEPMLEHYHRLFLKMDSLEM
jgi:hypothetical protein